MPPQPLGKANCSQLISPNAYGGMHLFSSQRDAPLIRVWTILFSTVVVCSECPALVGAADLAAVSLFDGRQTELLNTWGGAWSAGGAQGTGLQLRACHRASGPFASTWAPLGQGKIAICNASRADSAPRGNTTRLAI